MIKARTALSPRRGLLMLIALLIVVAARAALWPTCGILFRCGCAHALGIGPQDCNIFAASGPHCPWCDGPQAVGLIPQIALPLSTLLGFILGARRSIPRGLAWAASAFVIAALALGIGFAIANQYPFFLFFDLLFDTAPGR